jgi:hypothetical protein
MWTRVKPAGAGSLEAVGAESGFAVSALEDVLEVVEVVEVVATEALAGVS